MTDLATDAADRQERITRSVELCRALSQGDETAIRVAWTDYRSVLADDRFFVALGQLVALTMSNAGTAYDAVRKELEIRGLAGHLNDVVEGVMDELGGAPDSCGWEGLLASDHFFEDADLLRSDVVAMVEGLHLVDRARESLEELEQAALSVFDEPDPVLDGRSAIDDALGALREEVADCVRRIDEAERVEHVRGRGGSVR